MTGDCWQCSAALGSTPECMTCAAKRRDDLANNPHVKGQQRQGEQYARVIGEAMEKSPLLELLNRGSTGKYETLGYEQTCSCAAYLVHGVAARCSRCVDRQPQ